MDGDLAHNLLKFIDSATITRAGTAARTWRDFGVSKNQWDIPRRKSFAKALRALAKARPMLVLVAAPPNQS